MEFHRKMLGERHLKSATYKCAEIGIGGIRTALAPRQRRRLFTGISA